MIGLCRDCGCYRVFCLGAQQLKMNGWMDMWILNPVRWGEREYVYISMKKRSPSAQNCSNRLMRLNHDRLLSSACSDWPTEELYNLIQTSGTPPFMSSLCALETQNFCLSRKPVSLRPVRRTTPTPGSPASDRPVRICHSMYSQPAS